jgi:hypothetical protein
MVTPSPSEQVGACLVGTQIELFHDHTDRDLEQNGAGEAVGVSGFRGLVHGCAGWLSPTMRNAEQG